ncbi:MAG: DUF4230 domain-containing protein [Sedimentisphaerales bacterium]
MLYDIIYSIGLIAVAGGIAFFIGRRMAAKPKTKSKTTTFLLKSIQAIAELAVLEYRTEGVTEIKEKKTHLMTVRWKRGLLRYTAKLKVGFNLDQLDCTVDDLQKLIQIALPSPKVLSCEIYNRKFYKLPLEKAENVPWKYDIIEDFSSDEVLSLDEEARNNALQNVNELYVLDLLKDKTKMAFKKIVSLSYPEYSTEISIADLPAASTSPVLPGETDSKNQVSNNDKA